MNTYQLTLSSHTEAPDFEVKVEAPIKSKAILELLKRYDLDRETIFNNLERI
jgi:hypothetical protein